MEGKLDAFRTKLRSTKEQLKEAQDELERREAAKFAESAKFTAARMHGHPPPQTNTMQPQASAVPNPRKRNVARFDPDMTIGTPGQAAVKKPRTTMSNVGDKSTFSITPFLNRTQSILPDTPAEDQHEKIDEAINTTINELAEEADKESNNQKQAQKDETEQPDKEEKSKAKKGTAAGQKPAASKEKDTDAPPKPRPSKPLKESAPSRANKSAKQPTLSKVVEEEGSDSENQAPDVQNKPGPTTTVVEPSISEATTAAQPKKKKLLNGPRNIFDDDETDGIKKKITLGGGGRVGLGKVSLGGFNRIKPKVLAEFSPLKKDRRGGIGNGTVMIEG